MKWINELDNYNLIALYDVMIDIERELNESPGKIIIPLFQNIRKSSVLFPIDSITTRAQYRDTRFKAAYFLKKNHVINYMQIFANSQGEEIEVRIEKEKFGSVFSKIEAEYNERFKKTGIEESILIEFWELLHPKVVEVSKSRFEAKHFADSVEAALKEINNVVKNIVKEKTGQEYDGYDLMNRAFSADKPLIIIDDLSTETGKNIQKGYMLIFSGAMLGIRNPKAHANIVIDSKRAMHLLFLTSLLMCKIDEAR